MDSDFAQWHTWAEQHAPQVLRMKAPLTASELDKLTADFGRALVLDVFEAMHNHVPLLKKYSSANLTARDWCKRRAADPRPAGAAGSSPATAAPPSLATKLAAQRHTKRV